MIAIFVLMVIFVLVVFKVIMVVFIVGVVFMVFMGIFMDVWCVMMCHFGTIKGLRISISIPTLSFHLSS